MGPLETCRRFDCYCLIWLNGGYKNWIKVRLEEEVYKTWEAKGGERIYMKIGLKDGIEWGLVGGVN